MSKNRSDHTRPTTPRPAKNIEHRYPCARDYHPCGLGNIQPTPRKKMCWIKVRRCIFVVTLGKEKQMKASHMLSVTIALSIGCVTVWSPLCGAAGPTPRQI